MKSRSMGRRFTFAFVALAAFGATSLVAPRAARAEFPTLEVAIERARAYALVVADAAGELGAAQGHMAGARASAFGNPYTEVQVDRPFSEYDAAGRKVQALTFTYIPIDIAGQRGRRVEEAERLIEWRKIGLVDARAIATGEVVSAYGEYLVSWSRVEEAKAGEASSREEAKYFDGRFQAKDTTLYEKSVADAEVTRWVQSRAEAELRVANARARLAQITGLAEPGKPPAASNLRPPRLRATWDDAFVGHVVDKAPAISRILAEKTYWDASIERYQRERIPPVSFEIIAGRGGNGEARLGGGAVITFPVARRYQGEIARAEQGRSNATRRADLFRGVVASRLRAARDAIAAVENAVDELDKHGIPALELAVTTSVEAFRAGKIDLTRAMLARRDLATARARRLDLLADAWRAYADLVTLSGELP